MNTLLRNIFYIALLFAAQLLHAEVPQNKNDEELKDKSSPAPVKILMLSTFNVSYVQYQLESSSFIDALNQSGGSYIVDRFTFEKPCKPYSEKKLAELENYFDRIRAGEYKVVLIFYGPMLEMVRTRLHTFPSDVKFIVCGMTPSLAHKVPKAPNIYTVYKEVTITKNLQLIRKLFPDRKKVVFLTHWNLIGAELKRLAEAESKNFPDLKIYVPDNAKMSTSEMLTYIDELGDGVVVLYYGWYNKYAVNAASLQFLMNALGNNPQRPLFVMHTSFLCYGTVGGHMVSGSELGARLAGTVRRLVDDGDQPDKSVSANTVASALYLNHPMFGVYNINESAIPKDSVIVGKDSGENAFEKYRNYFFWILPAFCVILTSALFLVFSTIRFRKVARQIHNVFKSLPMRVMVTDANENILLYRIENEDSCEIKKLRDFSAELYPALKNILNEVLKTRSHTTAEYVLHGRHQRGNFVFLPKEIYGRPCVLGVGFDVNDLYYMGENEKIQNKCLRTVLSEFKGNASFSMILKSFCEHFHGDRCYLIRYDDKTRTASFDSEYCAEGIEPIKDAMKNCSMPELDAWFEKHKSHNVEEVHLEHHSTAEKSSLLLSRGVKDLYTMPIYFKNRLWGCWGLVFKRRRGVLTEVEKQAIPMIAHMIELILLRQSYISELYEARDKALVAAQTKSMFLATMSHELRTPLNAVIGFSDLLTRSSSISAADAEYVSGIGYAAKNLLGLINNILDFSKIESEQMKITEIPTDIGELFRELYAIYATMAQSKGLELRVHSQPVPSLLLDSGKVKQILTNLIGNAVKFTKNGFIEVEAKYGNSDLTITVSDTGSGISEDAQKFIFEPFFQVGDNSSAYTKGTGLGLVIAKRLAERMNGSLSISSKVGEGSKFTLVLREVKAAKISEKKSAADSDGTNPLGGGRASRVLIVDDSPVNLKVLGAILKNLGVEFRTAFSGAEALKTLETDSFDAMFTDLRMPEMDGAELAKRIRADRRFDEMKIAVVTADILLDKANGNFDCVLLKPISVASVSGILKTLKHIS